jgi:hypothetical protein
LWRDHSDLGGEGQRKLVFSFLDVHTYAKLDNDIATNNALGKSYISDNHQTTLLFSLTGQDLLPESIQ